MPQTSALDAFLGEAAEGPRAERAYLELLRFVRIVVRAEMGRRLRDHRESADVCQSIAKSFVDDLRGGRLRFENERALAAYLRLAVRNKLAELARRDRALKRGGGAEPTEGVHEAAAPHEDSEQPRLSREEWARLRDLLGEEERRLAELRMRGLEWEVIGAELGVSAAVARQRFSRMARRLREAP